MMSTTPTAVDRETKEFLLDYYSKHPSELFAPIDMSWLFFDDVSRMESYLRADWFVHYPISEADGVEVVTLDTQQAFLVPNATFRSLRRRQESLARMLSRLEDLGPAVTVVTFLLSTVAAVYLGDAPVIIFLWLVGLFCGSILVLGFAWGVTEHICRSWFDSLVLRESRQHGEAMVFPRIYALLLAARIERRQQEKASRAKIEKAKARIVRAREVKVLAAVKLGGLAVRIPLMLVGLKGISDLAGSATEKAIELGFKQEQK